MPDADLLKRLATAPIPGAAACGESIRYDEGFGRLEAEISKLENPAGGEVDWRAIEEGTADLLANRSKDVLLAAWLARALWQREGFAGLAAGLGMLREFLATFWGEQLHPQRIRPRRAALEWLSEKLASAISDEQLANDGAGAAACQAQLDAIVAWSSDRFEGEDCGLLTLVSRLRAAPQPAAAASSASSSGGSSGDSAPASSGGGGGGGASGPIANRAQAVARLRELAEWWARHEPSSPMVPLLKRALTWTDLDFPTLFALLLRSKSDAKDYMWDVLGLNDQQAN